jgi:hypothetical protein
MLGQLGQPTTLRIGEVLPPPDKYRYARLGDGLRLTTVTKSLGRAFWQAK